MAKLRFATFNCAGLASATRRRAVFSYLRSLNVQIFCLQETHSNTRDEHKWATEWGKNRACFHSNHANNRSNGVAFLINHPDVSFIDWHGDQNGRTLTADFNTPAAPIHVVNIYAPQCGRPARERSLFFDSLYLHLFSPHPTILAGDFNCVENPAIDRDPPSNKKDPTSTLRELRETFGLQDTLRATHGNTRLFTRRQGVSQSRIDRFYTCKKISPLLEWTLPGLASDHDIVAVEINSVVTPKHGKGRWKNNVAYYSDLEFKAQLQHKWSQWRTLQPYLFETKTDWWLQMKKRVQHLLTEHAKHSQSAERKREAELKRNVETLCRDVNDHPSLLPLYHQLKTQWCELKKTQANARAKKSRINAFENNDRGTKEFFLQFKHHRQQTSITQLLCPEGKPLINRQDILDETRRFFQALYQSHATCPEAQQAFLRHVNQTLDPDETDLTRPITTDEVRYTISQTKSGKSPGPDGLSTEFYKSNWDVIADDFTDVLNEIHASAHIPGAMKLGCITLIHKKNARDLLKNYRPISLLNADLKIYTKILANRLKRVLPRVVHAQQYARPGSQIFHVLTLLRDMQQHSASRGLDHFYLSLDFEKAFDSVDHHWLSQVLTKYGFPPHFVNIVAALQTGAASEVVVNGCHTQPFLITRGVRQGDPLSLFLFLIAVEPFLSAIRNDNRVLSIRTPGRFQIKTLCYADDITVTTTNSTSIVRVFETLQQLELASGLKVNYSKTCCLHTAKYTDANLLPQIRWEKNSLHILGSCIGSHESVGSIWDKCIKNITATAKHFSAYFLSWNAKSLIVKSKMLPLATYNANTYAIPPKRKQQINRIIEQFIAGHREITVPTNTLAQPLMQGGYNVPDIPLYCDIFFIRPILDYIKHRIDLTPATPQNAMVEFNIGHQLSNLLDLPQKNFLPHSVRPNLHYAHALALIKKFKLSSEHLYKLSVNQLYQLLVSASRFHPPIERTWHAVHNPVLTNTLRTFNYRAIREILPISTKLRTAYLDPGTVCRFCRTLPEKLQHIFYQCHRIKPVWTYIEAVISHLTDTPPMELNYYAITHFIISPQLKHISDHITYLFSITRYKIWMHRNEIDTNHIEFSATRIIQAIIRSTHRRLHMEKHTTQKKHVQLFEDLTLAMPKTPTA